MASRFSNEVIFALVNMVHHRIGLSPAFIEAWSGEISIWPNGSCGVILEESVAWLYLILFT
jgi:hypothetical protein